MIGGAIPRSLSFSTMPTEPATPSASSPRSVENLARKWLVAFVLVGIFLRLFRFVLPIPINGDEAMLGVNILGRSFAQLLKPLEYNQVAPLGFLWTVRAAYQWWGIDERSVRFFPALAGMLTVPLFAAWARMLEKPLAAAIATGILACGTYSVYEAVELKPYGMDLMCSLILLLPSSSFILHRQSRSLIWLIALTPIALGFSYPSIFVAAAVGLTLLTLLPKLPPRQIALVAVYGIVSLTSFYFLTWRLASGQYRESSNYMLYYWADALPPHNLNAFLIWLLKVHTGNMFAYPFGGKNGGSTLSTILFLIGVFAWIRAGRRRLVFLLLCPFALTMLAAALHRYPYGQATRVCQQLAPAIIIFIGIGAQQLFESISSELTRRKSATILFIMLMLIGSAQIAESIYAAWFGDYVGVRTVAQTLVQKAPPNSPLAIVGPRFTMLCNIQWYLWPQNDRIIWDAQNNLTAADASKEIWVLSGTKLENKEPDPQITQNVSQSVESILGKPPAWQGVWVYKVGDWTQWDMMQFPAQAAAATK
jgi:hypothetical protein